MEDNFAPGWEYAFLCEGKKGDSGILQEIGPIEVHEF